MCIIIRPSSGTKYKIFVRDKYRVQKNTVVRITLHSPVGMNVSHVSRHTLRIADESVGKDPAVILHRVFTSRMNHQRSIDYHHRLFRRRSISTDLTRAVAYHKLGILLQFHHLIDIIHNGQTVQSFLAPFIYNQDVSVDDNFLIFCQCLLVYLSGVTNVTVNNKCFLFFHVSFLRFP